MNASADISGMGVEARAHHPAELAMEFDAFTQKLCLHRHDKIPRHPSPHIMKVIVILPDIGASAADRIRLRPSIIHTSARVADRADVGLLRKEARDMIWYER